MPEVDAYRINHFYEAWNQCKTKQKWMEKVLDTLKKSLDAHNGFIGPKADNSDVAKKFDPSEKNNDMKFECLKYTSKSSGWNDSHFVTISQDSAGHHVWKQGRNIQYCPKNGCDCELNFIKGLTGSELFKSKFLSKINL